MKNQIPPSLTLLGEERWLETETRILELIDILSDARDNYRFPWFTHPAAALIVRVTTDLYFFGEVDSKLIKDCEEFIEVWLNRKEQTTEVI